MPVSQLNLRRWGKMNRVITSPSLVKVKLPTIVEGDQKAPFQLLLHQGVGEGTIPFPELLHFTLDTYLILLRVKQGGIKYHFFKSLRYDATWD